LERRINEIHKVKDGTAIQGGSLASIHEIINRSEVCVAINLRWLQDDGTGRSVVLANECWETALVIDQETGMIRIHRLDAEKKQRPENPPADVELYEIFPTSA